MSYDADKNRHTEKKFEPRGRSGESVGGMGLTINVALLNVIYTEL